ncbi:MAG: S8/S53 family peptidase [Lewinellaceae bacterium]|nr:S8/S53 family peptidase [Lewinellaceae bacterium]
MIGLIDIGIHPGLPYLSGYSIRLSTLDAAGRWQAENQAHKSDLHGSRVASILCGPFYENAFPSTTAIEAIAIPRRGKTILCLLRALDAMLRANIRVLCLPWGINLPTPVFQPFIKALTERGVLVVAPSGNKGLGTVLTPGTYPEVLTVGALDANGNIARYSGRYETGGKPELYARGTFPAPADPDSGKTIRGTSMACAWVAGKAARICQTDPKATSTQIKAQLGAEALVTVPPFLEKPYIDSRLQATLRPLEADDRREGIVISGMPAEPFQMDQLLKAVEAASGCAPQEVNYFSVENVAHVCASSRFFGALLQHQGLYCAQAVDVSMLDM